MAKKIKTVEGAYDFLENEEGEIMLVIDGREREPVKAKLLFDGEQEASLYRDEEEIIKLTEMPEGIIEPLAKVKQILVCEMSEEGDFMHTYDAPVVISKHIF